MPILGNKACAKGKYEADDVETIHSAEDSLWSAWYCGEPAATELEMLLDTADDYISAQATSTKSAGKKSPRPSFMQQQSGRSQYNRSVSNRRRPAKNYQNRRR